jgi:hypothetical protein
MGIGFCLVSYTLPRRVRQLHLAQEANLNGLIRPTLPKMPPEG